MAYHKMMIRLTEPLMEFVMIGRMVHQKAYPTVCLISPLMAYWMTHARVPATSKRKECRRMHR
jgi:hypothetical protein